MRKRVNKKCIDCGSEFSTVTPATLRCSRKCVAIAMRQIFNAPGMKEKRSKWREGRPKGFSKICPYQKCGVSFVSKTRARKYCSQRCCWDNLNLKKEKHPRWQGGKTTYKCASCKKEVLRYSKVVKTLKLKHVFCSNTCKNIYNISHNEKWSGTDIELVVNALLKKYGIEYSSQKEIPKICVADFFLEEQKVAIFCDGDYWHKYPYGLPKDKEQVIKLNEMGVKVWRYWGSEIQSSSFEEHFFDRIEDLSKSS